MGSATIVAFVFGMFIGGNYAFLHPLSVVALVASMATMEGIPMRKQSQDPEVAAAAPLTACYRAVAPWALLPLLLFAFLPSLRAYAARAQEFALAIDLPVGPFPHVS